MTVEDTLIEAVKARPLIWNTKNENYKNTKLKNEAFDEIAKEFNTSVADIKKKWHSIRSAFSRELRLKNLYSNVGNEKRVWKHFNKLMFLKDECELDLNGQEIENDYTVQIVSDDGTPDTLNSRIQLIENGDQSHQEIDNRRTQTKKRKTNNSNNHLSSNNNSSNLKSNNLPTTKALLINGEFCPKFNTLSEEEIFGQSIALSLKKFDPVSKETVKLRLQEVIVQHLQSVNENSN